MTLALVVSRKTDGLPPPWSEEAEVAVLSACMIDPRLIPHVRSVLRPEHFGSGRNGHIYAAILAVVDAAKAVDVVSVGEYLRDTGRLFEAGGMSALTEILNSPYTVLTNTTTHAWVIYDKWRVREAIRRCQLGAAVGYTDHGEVQAYLRGLRVDLARLEDAGASTPSESNLDVLKGAVRELTQRVARGSHITGIPTGLDPYDRRTAGLHSGHLTVIGARPGLGKTALLGQVAASVASGGIGVGFVSLEMTRREILERMVCARATVNTMRFRDGNLSQTQWADIQATMSQISKWPLWFDDRVNRNIHQVRESVYGFLKQAEAAKVPLGVVVIDYLQFITPSEEKRRAPLREALAEASKSLKELARELGIPIVVAVALNRDVDKSGAVRFPRKSDIRDCGNIESDADNIVFIHRKARVVDEKETFVDDGEAWLIIDKQRGGMSGDPIKVRFEGQYARFVEAYP